MIINRNISCLIDSDYLLEDLERPFKVIAGPGAGKTYWLVKNIKHILNNSKKLHRNSKIACITYTNVGVEEINKELSSGFENVEVSTIHSFLYKNVLRPYVYMLNQVDEEIEINIDRLRGQENNIPSKSLVDGWRNEDKINYLSWSNETNSEMRKVLGGLKWSFDDEEIKLTSSEYISGPTIRQTDYLKFKQYCWKRGIIYHDDIIYLSFQLLQRFSYIAKAISSRYTYLLLDEFQDTNIIQSKIVKILSEAGSIVGVVGDPAQSIYKFQGATRQAFIDFHVDNQVDYIIHQNRRSGKNIVQFLNVLRMDNLTQTALSQETADYVFIHQYQENVDNIKHLFERKRLELNLQDDFSILAYQHAHISLLKSSNNEEENVWESIHSLDGDRHVLLYKILKAYRLFSEKMLDLAFNELLSALRLKGNSDLVAPFKSTIKEHQRRSVALDIILFTVQWIEGCSGNRTLKEFYNELSQYLLNNHEVKLPKITRGTFNAFATECTVQSLVEQIKVNEFKVDHHRTIHGVKGAEFESVLVYLDNANQLIKPDINNSADSTRIFYVGCSRPKRMLFIAIPEMDEKSHKLLLEKYGTCLTVL